MCNSAQSVHWAAGCVWGRGRQRWESPRSPRDCFGWGWGSGWERANHWAAWATQDSR